MKQLLLSVLWVFCLQVAAAQDYKAAFEAIYQESKASSDLPALAHRFIDQIGPRLVGSPQMQKAHEFVVQQYQDWGIDAYNEQWGTWQSWQRQFTHVDMTAPWPKTMEAIQMAWCPNMKKPLTAEVVLLPFAADSLAFDKMLPSLKGKIVLISPVQSSGRPTSTYEKFIGKAGADSIAMQRQRAAQQWAKQVSNTGFTTRTLPKKLEDAGVAGLVLSSWTDGWGALKVFAARTTKIPAVEMSVEDYNLLARLAASNSKPQLRMHTTSKWGGMVPAYNTMAKIKGTEKPEEIVMLSAHIDSWDAGTGATDNGTGVLTMMEAMRILKKVYPHPKRTIMVGHWGSEEQGLNGSRSFTEDHPELLDKISMVFNQDNGTGKINTIATQGFVNAYAFFDKWLAYLPDPLKGNFNMTYPGFPDVGGSDNMAFLPKGVPAFYLASSNDWDYRIYTWHTQRDTYDKIVFDELQQNAMLVAMLVYMASEEPTMLDRTRIKMPIDITTGKERRWPEPGKAGRTGPK
jgi:carboxypeptidase Q